VPLKDLSSAKDESECHAVQPLERMMPTKPDYRPVSRFAATLCAAVAVFASCSSLVAVFALFDSAGSTPWFASEQAALAAHCDAASAPPQRHACLKAAAHPAATRVAAR
jgi:hypothetical protein